MGGCGPVLGMGTPGCELCSWCLVLLEFEDRELANCKINIMKGLIT